MTLDSQIPEIALESSIEPQGKIQKTNPLSIKLNAFLNTSFDDQNTIDALDVLDSFYSPNLLSDNKDLRSIIQERSIILHDQFLDSFSDLKNQINQIQISLDQVNETCHIICSDLDQVIAKSSVITENTELLLAEKQDSENKLLSVKSFCEKFTLTLAEETALTSTLNSSNDKFFDALKHLQLINKDSQILLNTEYQQAGLELISKMGVYEEQAYSVLFNWTLTEIKSLNREAPEISTGLKRALSYLNQRPILFEFYYLI